MWTLRQLWITFKLNFETKSASAVTQFDVYGAPDVFSTGKKIGKKFCKNIFIIKIVDNSHFVLLVFWWTRLDDTVKKHRTTSRPNLLVFVDRASWTKAFLYEIIVFIVRLTLLRQTHLTLDWNITATRARPYRVCRPSIIFNTDWQGHNTLADTLANIFLERYRDPAVSVSPLLWLDLCGHNNRYLSYAHVARVFVRKPRDIVKSCVRIAEYKRRGLFEINGTRNEGVGEVSHIGRREKVS